jgi:hypothetical protein
MSAKELIADISGGLLNQVDNLNSKRFWGFAGAGGFVGWATFAGLVAGPLGVGVIAGLAVVYGTLESVFPSKPKDCPTAPPAAPEVKG